MPDAPASSPPPWVGWIRTPGRCWARAVEAKSSDAAWDLLVAHAKNTQHSELVVLRGTDHPNQRKGRQ